MHGARVSGEALKETHIACRQADYLHRRARVSLTVAGDWCSGFPKAGLPPLSYAERQI